MNAGMFDNSFQLKGKSAVITGAANGIGKASAELFAEKGAKLILVDLSDKVVTVAKSLQSRGLEAVPLVMDITKRSNIEEIAATALQLFGKIDILANIAGAVALDAAENLDESIWDQQMTVNAKSTFLMSQVVGKEMIKNKRGKIINIASQAGFIAIEKHLAYSASKAAVIMMTKVLALEWAKFGINVNVISPTVVWTEMGEKAWPGEVGEAMKRTIPLGRFAYPEEIAASVLFLASEASNMITGENIVVDGGFTIK